MPQSRGDAVGARIAAADHEHVFAAGAEVRVVAHVGVEQALGVAGEEIHGEADALEFAAGDRQVTGPSRSGRQQYGVVPVPQIAGTHVLDLLASLEHDPSHVSRGERLRLAHVDVRAELDSFVAQQLDAPLDDALLELHVGNAVHQQATDAVGALEDGHPMSHFVQLSGSGQSGGARADDRDPLAGPGFGRLRGDPTFRETPVDDRVLDVS